MLLTGWGVSMAALSLPGSAAVIRRIPQPQPNPPHVPPVEVAATQPATAPAATQPATSPAAMMQSPTTLPIAADPAAIKAAADKLADTNWRTREQALSDLIRMGEAAVPALQKLEQTTSIDEVRNAAQTALRQIGENRLVGPSFVTLHLKDATPRQAFEELARQSFTRFKPLPDELWAQAGQQRVTLDVDHQPFWVAMRELSKKTGVELVCENGQTQLSLVGVTRMGSRHGTVAGAFLIIPMQASLNRTVDFENDDPVVEEDFSLQLSAFPEPKLKVIRQNPGFKVLEAVDDKGNSLIPDEPGPNGVIDDLEGVMPGSGDGSFMLSTPLKRPKKIGTKLARFRASVGFKLQIESRMIEIKDLKTIKDLSYNVNGTRVVLNDFKKDNDQYQLRITFPMDPNNPIQMTELQNNIGQRLRLLDAKGEPMESHGLAGGDGEGNQLQFTMNFSRSMQEDGKLSGEPVRLEWEIPTKSRDIEVIFELKDLKIP
jgi:hypothetical protein